MDNKVLFIIGPTATGKSKLAAMLAKKLDGEIISADSMQVYKGMDIGTAKPSLKELKEIPHYLINMIPPDKPWSVSDFIDLAEKNIVDILGKGELPIVVGGTGMYLYALLYGFDFPEIKKDSRFRSDMEKEDLNKLYEKLKLVDPASAGRIHANDRRRIIRALEVFELTGKPMSAQSSKGRSLPYTPILIGLNMDRDKLYKRIEERVDAMLKAGLVGEVRSLLKKGLDTHSIPMQAIGYKEVAKYLRNEWTEAEMVKMLKQNTRNFARRQLTWFRRFRDVHWFEVDKLKLDDIIGLIKGG